MRIVFFGSQEFGIPSLEALQAASHTIVGIVTTPPKPAGRGQKLITSPIYDYAEAHKFSPILTPATPQDTDLPEKLAALQADVFIVIAYRILPEAIFTIPKRGTYNVHASILPRYRGAAPIHRALQAGDTKTGITIFRIDKGIDTGEILCTAHTDIVPTETTPQCAERLALLGAQNIVPAMRLVENDTAIFTFQDSSGATPAKKLLKEEAHIAWNTSARTLFNCIRAFKPFPGCYSLLNNRRLGIEWAIPHESESADLPGSIVNVTPSSFFVACERGTLEITQVKPEGKKSMSAGDFLRGAKLTKGILLS